MVKRTPSTSAIYETLRRSKELRESLSRPSSRLSIDNIPDKLKEPVSNLIRILPITPFSLKFVKNRVCHRKRGTLEKSLNLVQSHF